MGIAEQVLSSLKIGYLLTNQHLTGKIGSQVNVHLANGETENANKVLDKMINDENAPASISATAQTLK